MGIDKIEDCIWNVKMYLARKYGITIAEIDISPLEWYISTGRASTDFIRKMLNEKAFRIGRILHKSGSYEDAINNLKIYFNIW